MGKRLVAVLALALLVGATFSTAYAEVQNVKVSGDINIIGVARNNFSLGTPIGSDNPKEKNRLFGTQTRVRVDADLTDNVAATVRLINERSWNTEDNSNTDIDLDLAYVTLKEFLYSPLTLTLGRQEIRFGNQLIIGNSNNYIGTGTGNVLNGFPADLSVRNSFDAMRATLNYDPLVIDLVYSKLKNNDTNTSDDADLFGINASYDVTKDLNVQAYIWDKRDKSEATDNSKKDNVYTLGGLATFRGIEDLVLSLEGA
ncbi:MAG: porin, partial [Candidatus Omnitrophica bacterium]|nr:porin [Candidatus Omnitrophota bacterium]